MPTGIATRISPIGDAATVATIDILYRNSHGRSQVKPFSPEIDSLNNIGKVWPFKGGEEVRALR
jgi:hypothetical protein